MVAPEAAGCLFVVDYPLTSRISTLAGAAAALSIAALAVALPGPVNPLDLSLTLVLALAVAVLCLYDAWRVFQGRVRDPLYTSQAVSYLSVALLLGPFLLDPQGAAARPLHATLHAGLALVIAFFAAHTAWASVAAGVPVRLTKAGASAQASSTSRARGSPPTDRL
ncbi:MAG TPA: hypothetical protein VNZ52_06465 [Candidatus Thermoplasmatota archaeon]|nr:hypothetical protein [Candidatus Thermoplasmatota archaeon]